MSEYTKSLSDEQVANMRDHFYKLGWGQNETMWECWNQALDYIAPQLSASQAREKELREKLEAAEARGDVYSARAFKAEQEYQTILEHCRTLEAIIKASREQSILGTVTYSELRGYSFVPHPDYASIYRGSVYAQPPIPPELAELQRENAELRKLLEERKVPEGCQLVPKQETEAMHDAVMAVLYKGVSRMNTQKLLDAYLAAAPQPKEPKQ